MECLYRPMSAVIHRTSSMLNPQNTAVWTVLNRLYTVVRRIGTASVCVPSHKQYSYQSSMFNADNTHQTLTSHSIRANHRPTCTDDHFLGLKFSQPTATLIDLINLLPLPSIMSHSINRSLSAMASRSPLLAILFFFLSLALSTLPVHSAPPKHNWGGCDSYFLYAMSEPDRIAHLSAMHDAGMKVVRIFVTGVGKGSKGSSATDVPDLEPETVGVYDDTILEKIDQLLYEAVSYGVKLDMSVVTTTHSIGDTQRTIPVQCSQYWSSYRHLTSALID